MRREIGTVATAWFLLAASACGGSDESGGSSGGAAGEDAGSSGGAGESGAGNTSAGGAAGTAGAMGGASGGGGSSGAGGAMGGSGGAAGAGGIAGSSGMAGNAGSGGVSGTGGSAGSGGGPSGPVVEPYVTMLEDPGLLIGLHSAFVDLNATMFTVGPIAINAQTNAIIGGELGTQLGATGASHDDGGAIAHFFFRFDDGGSFSKNSAFPGVVPGTFDLGATQILPSPGDITFAEAVQDASNPGLTTFVLRVNNSVGRVDAMRPPGYSVAAADRIVSSDTDGSNPFFAAHMSGRIFVTTDAGDLCDVSIDGAGFGTVNCLDGVLGGPSQIDAGGSGFLAVGDTTGNAIVVYDASNPAARPTEARRATLSGVLGIAAHASGTEHIFCGASPSSNTVHCIESGPGGFREGTIDVSSVCSGATYLHILPDGSAMFVTCDDGDAMTDGVARVTNFQAALQ